MKQNYFTHFGLQPQFFIDEGALKRTYYTMSRDLHPDLTADNNEEQSKVLELSSFHNKAYETLKSFDGRVAYILRSNGLIGGEEQPKMDQEFLFEMMELNEAASELADSKNAEERQKIYTAIEERRKMLLDQVEPLMKDFDQSQDNALLTPVLDYYLKYKYLNRLEETARRQEPSL